MKKTVVVFSKVEPGMEYICIVKVQMEVEIELERI
jgi:hypothetical protein